jgi:hypothetical protein
MIEDPRLLIVLREPVVAHGLAGFRKTVNTIAISPDDDSALDGWISDARNALDPATPESADRR